MILELINSSCFSMLRLISKIKSKLPDVFIHSIKIGETPEEDRKRSLLDNMNRQIKEVCDQLAGIPELSQGFNAIGISQGGQFMRAYVERCNSPRVKKLITLGSQHQGVMSLPGCKENNSEGSLSIEESEAASRPISNFFQLFSSSRNTGNSDNISSLFQRSFLGKIFAIFKTDKDSENCTWWKRALKLGVYSPLVRSQVVQAQYFKDPNHLSEYFQHNQFLLDINNDHPNPEKRNPGYAKNLSTLDAFIMYIFEEDSVVVPKESGWFAMHDPKESKIKYLKELSIYREDRIGLKVLDENGKLFFKSLPGEHLRLSNQFLTGELVEILR